MSFVLTLVIYPMCSCPAFQYSLSLCFFVCFMFLQALCPESCVPYVPCILCLSPMSPVPLVCPMSSVSQVAHLKYCISMFLYPHLGAPYLRHILCVPCDLRHWVCPISQCPSPPPTMSYVLELHFHVSVSPDCIPRVLSPRSMSYILQVPVSHVCPQQLLLTLSSVVRSPSLAWIAKAMRQMAAATHMRHCRPPASCRANLTYSGVPRGGLRALGPSRSSRSAARPAVRPWGQGRWSQWLLRAFLALHAPWWG